MTRLQDRVHHLGGRSFELGGRPELARAGSGATLTERDPRSVKRQVLGIPGATIADGATATVTVDSTTTVVPRAMVFDAIGATLPGQTNLAGLSVIGIKINSKDQILNSTPIPLSVFSPDAVNSYIDFDTMPASNKIVITLRNDSGESRDISGAAFVDAVEY